MMWAQLSQSNDVIALLTKRGCMCTAKDEKGIANIREALAKFKDTPDSPEAKEVQSLLRATHTTWRQRWHCIESMPDLTAGTSGIAQRLQDGLLDGSVGPRELADLPPKCTLEEFIASLDNMQITDVFEVPEEHRKGGRVLVCGAV